MFSFPSSQIKSLTVKLLFETFIYSNQAIWRKVCSFLESKESFVTALIVMNTAKL